MARIIIYITPKMKQLLFLLIPIMSFGQADTVERFNISDILDYNIEFVDMDTSAGNQIAVYNDTIFEIRGDTMEVIKMLWQRIMVYEKDADFIRKMYYDLSSDYKQHLLDDRKRFDNMLKQLNK